LLAKLEKQVGAHVLSRHSKGNVAGEYSILCPRAHLMEAVAILRANGSGGAVTAQNIEYVFMDSDPLIASFEKALRK